MLEGNPARRPLPPNEPRPLSGEPEMPAYLDREARRQWKRLVPILLSMRVLTVADGMALATLCQAHSILVEALQDKRKASKGGGSGLLMKTPSRLRPAIAADRDHQQPGGDYSPDLARIRADPVVASAARSDRAEATVDSLEAKLCG